MSKPSDAIPASPSPRRLHFIDPNIFRDIRTYIALTGLVIGIVGLYHYYESVRERVPTYYVSPARARIRTHRFQRRRSYKSSTKART